MADYHCGANLIRRSAGRSSTAAAAYRAGQTIVDQRTGEVHDYTRKGRGVVSADLVLPEGIDWAPSREEFWNGVEAKNVREDAIPAREFLVALPHELDEAERRDLALMFARELADRYQIAADVCVHKPDRKGDQRNHHAHILTTTNTVTNDDSSVKKRFGNKVRELDNIAAKRSKDMREKHASKGPIDQIRELWGDMANGALAMAGSDSRVDHRSFEDRGIEDEPTIHLGPAASAMERRKKGSSAKGRENEERRERNLVRDLITQDIDDDQIYIDRLEAELDEVELAQDIERHYAERNAIAAQYSRVRTIIREARERKVEQVMTRAQERLRPQMEKLADFMDEWGFPGSERLRKRLNGSDGADAPAEPENASQEAQRPPETEKPLTLQEEFDRDRHQRELDDHEDDRPGPSP